MGLRRDLLYLWATFRMRNRPLKMVGMLVSLGALCWMWQWAGTEWAEPYFRKYYAGLGPGFAQEVAKRTVRAIFSTLNFLSCVSIFIMGRTLRSILKEGHLEMLLLTPRHLYPSALFYAVCTRYLPLAFIAVLVIFIDPQGSPFLTKPFTFPLRDPLPVDGRPLVWAGGHLLSILYFCPANLFMDLAMAYWWMSRWKVSYPTIGVAVLLIGVVSPVLLVSLYGVVDQMVYARVIQEGGLLADWARGSSGALASSTVRDMTASIRYTSIATVSIFLGLVALWNLDRRWNKAINSPQVDPIMLRPIG